MKKIKDIFDLSAKVHLKDIGFFELLVTLESGGIKLNRLKTNSNIKLPIEEYDTVQKMIENMK